MRDKTDRSRGAMEEGEGGSGSEIEAKNEKYHVECRERADCLARQVIVGRRCLRRDVI